MALAAVTAHTGVILGTGRYQDCLRFGSGYVMIETGGKPGRAEMPVAENPAVLRFHVPDFDVAADALRRAGIAVNLQHFNRGSIGVFVDPDGNPCELAKAWDQTRTS